MASILNILIFKHEAFSQLEGGLCQKGQTNSLYSSKSQRLAVQLVQACKQQCWVAQTELEWRAKREAEAELEWHPNNKYAVIYVSLSLIHI